MSDPYSTQGCLDIVSDEQLDAAWGNANFGGMTKREVVAMGVLKCASGYHQGHTGMMICTDLGLISNKYELTAKGRAYLWEAMRRGSTF